MVARLGKDAATLAVKGFSTNGNTMARWWRGRHVNTQGTMRPHGASIQGPYRFLEIACFNVQSAFAAEEAGADRIELCAGADVGGTTPSLEDANKVKEKGILPVNVMIRPRGGNFVYTESEFAQMKDDIRNFKQSTAVDGFVFGILDEEDQLDQARCRELVDIAAPKPCTFHRAVDEVVDMVSAAELIATLGFAAVLTSGGKPTAVEGEAQLLDISSTSRGKLEVIVGGGVRSSNVARLMESTRSRWFHSSALVGNSSVASTEEIKRLKEIITNG